MMPRRSPRVTTAGLAERLAGCDLAVIDVDDPPHRHLAEHRDCRRRRPRTLPT